MLSLHPEGDDGRLPRVAPSPHDLRCWSPWQSPWPRMWVASGRWAECHFARVTPASPSRGPAPQNARARTSYGTTSRCSRASSAPTTPTQSVSLARCITARRPAHHHHRPARRRRRHRARRRRRTRRLVCHLCRQHLPARPARRRCRVRRLRHLFHPLHRQASRATGLLASLRSATWSSP